MDWKAHLKDHPHVGGYYTRVASQPSWVTRAAVSAALLVVVVPIVLITLAALVVGLTVFVVGSLVARSLAWLRGLGGSSNAPASDDGRVNVRVIQRP